MLFNRYKDVLNKEVFETDKPNNDVLNHLCNDLKNICVHFIVRDDYHELTYELHEAYIILNHITSKIKNDDSLMYVEKFKGIFESFSWLHKTEMKRTKFRQSMEVIRIKGLHTDEVIDYLNKNPNSKIDDIASGINQDKNVIKTTIDKLCMNGAVEYIYLGEDYNLYSLSTDGYEYFDKVMKEERK